eukprot:1850389-Rhodomonas_salina.2
MCILAMLHRHAPPPQHLTLSQPAPLDMKLREVQTRHPKMLLAPSASVANAGCVAHVQSGCVENLEAPLATWAVGLAARAWADAVHAAAGRASAQSRRCMLLPRLAVAGGSAGLCGGPRACAKSTPHALAASADAAPRPHTDALSQRHLPRAPHPLLPCSSL